MAKKVALPTENKPKQRSVAEIQQEYTGLALRSGQLQYQIFTFNKDLELLNKQMRDLNFEAAAAKARDDQELAKQAQQVAESQTGSEESSNG